MIHSILPVQFMCLAVFLHNLSPSPLWSTSCSGTLHFIIRTFLPNHCLLFASHVHTIANCFAVVPRLCHLILVSQLITWNSIFYLNITHPSDHSQLKCHLIFFPYGPGLTSMQCTTLCTTDVQSPSHYQWYIHIGKQWYQLLEFIPLNSNSGLRSCMNITIHTQHVSWTGGMPRIILDGWST